MNTTFKNNLIDAIRIPDDAFSTSRELARQALTTLSLPTIKCEDYKHIPITRLLEKSFESLETTIEPSSLNADKFTIKELDAYKLIFINGVFNREQSHVPDEAGLTIKPLQRAMAENKNVVEAYFGVHLNYQSDVFVALNTAIWNHGLYIEVAKDTVVKKPIIIHHITDAHTQKVVSACRNLFVLHKDSKISIVEKYDSVGTANFSTTINEVMVAEGANLTLKIIQNDQGSRYQVHHTVVHQASGSCVNCFTLSLSGRLIRNNLQLIVDGEYCESHLNGLYLLKDDTIADNHTVVDHRKANSVSNELYKGVMDDHAKGIFNGKIFVRPNAQKTNAFQSNRNIILSDNASINTKPQLEIWADDVKCSHGCTSGQLDEEALFYLQSRGIDKAHAKALLLYAYAGEVVQKIENEKLRAYIDGLVSERLHKQD